MPTLHFKQSLIGQFVTLLPYEDHHIASLTEIGKNESIWQFNRAAHHPMDCFLSEYFETLAAEMGKGTQAPYVVIRNHRSIAAVKKLGAVQEGVLRKHKIVQGDFVRDTVLCSVVDTQWLDVKSRLQDRLKPVY